MEGDGGGQRPAAAEDPAAALGLTPAEYEQLRLTIDVHHIYRLAEGRRQCSSILAQRVRSPAETVWSVVRRFDKPQTYKHFIKSCELRGGAGGGIEVGCLRDVSVISGLPASTSTERLDVLDDAQRVTGFSIIGGEHRLSNYRSVTTVSEMEKEAVSGEGEGDGDGAMTVVVESYVVDVPEGNTEEDTRLFADTVVRLNLQKLAAAAEAMVKAANKSGGSSP